VNIGSRLLKAIDSFMVQAASWTQRLLLWPLVIVMGAGISAWAWRHEAVLAKLASNKLPHPARVQMLMYVAAAVGVLALLVVIGAIVSRLVKGAWRWAEVVTGLSRALAFVAAGPFLFALSRKGVEQSDPLWSLIFVGCAAAAFLPTIVWLTGSGAGSGDTAEGAAAIVPSAASRASLGARVVALLEKYAAPLTVLLLWIGYAYFFSKFSITNHHAFGTRTTDLGYYDNIFYQSIHGRPLGCTFIKGGYHGSAHFDPLLVILSPLYLIYPRAETLLVLQSVWCGAGVIPVYLIAKRELKSPLAGVLLAAAYAAYPALHGANMYEFHSLTLLNTPVLWALYFLEGRRWRWYYPVLCVVLLTREDAALLMCFVGAWAVLSKRHVRAGWITIVLSMLYFGVVKAFFMTSTDIFMSGKESYSFEYYYRELIPNRHGMLGLLASLLTNPAYVLKHVMKEAKVVYFLQLFVPLAFVPLAARGRRFKLIYGLVFLFLATRKPVYSVYFQYSTVLFPLLFAITPAGIKSLTSGTLPELFKLRPHQLQRAILGAIVVCSVLTSWKFGGILKNDAFRGGFSRPARELTEAKRDRYVQLRAIWDEHIEPGAVVSTTNRVGAHLSNRKHAYFYRQKKPSHYAFIDERELKKKWKGWHKRRLQRGELEFIDGVKSLKLYRIVGGDLIAGNDGKASKARPSSSAASSAAEPEAEDVARERRDERDEAEAGKKRRPPPRRPRRPKPK
jgi:uncharacterized membrane protein